MLNAPHFRFAAILAVLGQIDGTKLSDIVANLLDHNVDLRHGMAEDVMGLVDIVSQGTLARRQSEAHSIKRLNCAVVEVHRDALALLQPGERLFSLLALGDIHYRPDEDETLRIFAG